MSKRARSKSTKPKAKKKRVENPESETDKLTEESVKVDLSKVDKRTNFSIRQIVGNSKGGKKSTKQLALESQSVLLPNEDQDNGTIITEDEAESLRRSLLGLDVPPEIPRETLETDAETQLQEESQETQEVAEERQEITSNSELLDDGLTEEEIRAPKRFISVVKDGELKGLELSQYTGPRGSAKDKKKKRKWSEQETKLFYEGIHMFYTDFGMITKLFPGRDRHAVLLKFKQEENKNPEKIDKALKNPKPIDLQLIKSKVGNLEELETILSALNQKKVEQELNSEIFVPPTSQTSLQKQNSDQQDTQTYLDESQPTKDEASVYSDEENEFLGETSTQEIQPENTLTELTELNVVNDNDIQITANDDDDLSIL